MRIVNIKTCDCGASMDAEQLQGNQFLIKCTNKEHVYAEIRRVGYVVEAPEVKEQQIEAQGSEVNGKKHSFLAVDGKEYYADEWYEKGIYNKFQGEKGNELRNANIKQLSETQSHMIRGAR